MSKGFVARRYRFQAQQYRLMAKKMRFEEIRHELEALARQYDELADYIEAKAKRSKPQATEPIKKRCCDAPGEEAEPAR